MKISHFSQSILAPTLHPANSERFTDITTRHARVADTAVGRKHIRAPVPHKEPPPIEKVGCPVLPALNGSGLGNRCVTYISPGRPLMYITMPIKKAP